MPINVTVLEIKDMGMGNLRAYATLMIGALVIYRVKLVKQPGQRAYISPPQFEYFANGRVNYTPVLKWPDEWKQPIFDAVWTAYDRQRTVSEDALELTFALP